MSNAYRTASAIAKSAIVRTLEIPGSTSVGFLRPKSTSHAHFFLPLPWQEGVGVRVGGGSVVVTGGGGVVVTGGGGVVVTGGGGVVVTGGGGVVVTGGGGVDTTGVGLVTTGVVLGVVVVGVVAAIPPLGMLFSAIRALVFGTVIPLMLVPLPKSPPEHCRWSFVQ